MVPTRQQQQQHFPAAELPNHSDNTNNCGGGSSSSSSRSSSSRSSSSSSSSSVNTDAEALLRLQRNERLFYTFQLTNPITIYCDSSDEEEKEVNDGDGDNAYKGRENDYSDADNEEAEIDDKQCCPSSIDGISDTNPTYVIDDLHKTSSNDNYNLSSSSCRSNSRSSSNCSSSRSSSNSSSNNNVHGYSSTTGSALSGDGVLNGDDSQLLLPLQQSKRVLSSSSNIHEVSVQSSLKRVRRVTHDDHRRDTTTTTTNDDDDDDDYHDHDSSEICTGDDHLKDNNEIDTHRGIKYRAVWTRELVRMLAVKHDAYSPTPIHPLTHLLTHLVTHSLIYLLI